MDEREGIEVGIGIGIGGIGIGIGMGGGREKEEEEKEKLRNEGGKQSCQFPGFHFAFCRGVGIGVIWI